MVFQNAVVNEKVYDWGDNVISKTSDLDSAIDGVERFIDRLRNRLNVSELLFCFTETPNFRYDVLPTYKHNRKDTDKPDMLYQLRQYVEDNYEIKVKPRLEADDVMGILGTLTQDKYIICTIDKDLKQIAGHHYNWMHDETFEISWQEAELYFYTQVLTGDSTDGYRGCPYIGVKRAKKLFDEMKPFETYWEVVVKAYEAKGLTEENALQQARVARILQKNDWDFKRNTHILWTPPSSNIMDNVEEFQVRKGKGNYIVVNSKTGAHTHMKSYDKALVMVRELVSRKVPRDTDLQFLESFARVAPKKLAKEAEELLAVRESKGRKDNYVNSQKGVRT